MTTKIVFRLAVTTLFCTPHLGNSQALSTDALRSDQSSALAEITDARSNLEASSQTITRESDHAAFGRMIQDYLRTYSTSSAERRSLRIEALNAYIAASDTALLTGRTRYTREIAELAVEINDRALLDRQFDKFLQNSFDTKGLYLARIDYGDALAKFKDPLAKKHLADAVAMRQPRDGVEAYVRYSKYLAEHGDPDSAIELLENFRATDPLVDGVVYVEITLMRQQLIRSLGRDTSEVDEEMAQIRRAVSGAIGIGPIPKLSAKAAEKPTNIFGLSEVHAFRHNNTADDSRGPNATSWMTMPSGAQWGSLVINGAEVIYNEARGESFDGRMAVAWGVRNRALINMNGCDFYPGAEGHGGVTACRLATPGGPQAAQGYDPLYKAYSCVVHGGTTTVGAFHLQMNDGHVSGTTLEPTGFLTEMFAVANGWVDDPTSASTPSGTFDPPLNPPFFINITDGNPAGAQEWRSQNYCAERPHCKVRLGNVGGNLPDPGNPCPNDGPLTTDNFFWGRQP